MLLVDFIHLDVCGVRYVCVYRVFLCFARGKYPPGVVSTKKYETNSNFPLLVAPG